GKPPKKRAPAHSPAPAASRAIPKPLPLPGTTVENSSVLPPGASFSTITLLASPLSALFVNRGFATGKSGEVVKAVAQTAPAESSARLVTEVLARPPRYVEYTSALPTGASFSRTALCRPVAWLWSGFTVGKSDDMVYPPGVQIAGCV